MPFQKDWARTVIAGLGRDAFTQFVDKLLGDHYKPNFRAIPDLGPLPCFSRRLYPESLELRRQDDWWGIQKSTGLYLVDHLPLQVLSNPRPKDIHSPQLLATVENVQRTDWKDRCVIFILNNSAFGEPERLQNIVLPAYDEVLSSHGLDLSSVGNADSLADVPSTSGVLTKFLAEYWDGLAVALDRDGPRVDPFIAQSYLASAISTDQSGPFEPVCPRPVAQLKDVIQEFERMLSSTPSERQLEEFFREYYREIFGFKYDRIETQLWLRLPSADVRGKYRRTDLFLRNAASRDWELIELKRSTVPLVGNYRDVPTLAKCVHDSMYQIENYLRLLRQDQIRRQLATDGIEYFEPVAQLVIGRQPSITTKEWRWLQSTNCSGINVVSYDHLLCEMKERLRGMTNLG
jgi:Shedu protein SduA, C-terminal